jgi:hypothetical protein
MWITRAIQTKQFPPPIKFGEGVAVRRRWRAEDVLRWEQRWVSALEASNV